MWKVLHASAVGTSHTLSQLPCQDAYVIEQIHSSLILVGADGAGSCEKAQEGAHMTCHLVKEVLFPYAQKKMLPEREAIIKMVTDIQKELETKAAQAVTNVKEYSCTLLGALLTENGACFFQIGDGSLIHWPKDKNGEVIFWPPKFEYANQSAFITDTNASDTLQFCHISKPISEVALLTDGLEKVALQLSEKKVFEPFFKPIRACLNSLEETSLELNQKLAEFLNSPQINQRTDDDKTLIVAQVNRL